MLQRRACPRVRTSYAVLYHTDFDPRPKAASALDLSVGGVLMETSDGLALGDGLYITLAMHSKLIKCKGEVVHVLKRIGERLRAGIRFEGLFKQDRLFLEALISYVMAGAGEASPAKGMVIGTGLGLLVWAAIVSLILALI